MSGTNLPRLFLHIGSPKTGTTSFQHFMNENFSFLLNDLSLYYPFCENDNTLSAFELQSGYEGFFSISECLHNNGQRILASNDPFSLLKEVARFARDRSVDVVISDENLSAFSHPETPFLLELKVHFDVIPVLVVRDPLEYIFASYLQTLKGSNYSGSFDEFVSSQPRGSIQCRFYREWSQAFDSLKVLPFKAIKADLIRSLLKSFGRSNAALKPCADDFSVKSNTSLSAECYEVIRRLNQAGLHALARRFASLHELSQPQGTPPMPDPVYSDAACMLHDGLFDYLEKSFGLPPEAFINATSAQMESGSNSAPPGIATESLDILVAAVKEFCALGLADGQEPPAMSAQPSRAQQLALERIAGSKSESSPWGKFCPAEFSPEDYVTLGGLLNTRPHEEWEEFDPFRHYVMYGRYGGYAIKRSPSIYEQLDSFGNSPFIGYVPNDFDADSYLRLNADVQQAGVDPYHHYWAYGLKEGRIYQPPPCKQTPHDCAPED